VGRKNDVILHPVHLGGVAAGVKVRQSVRRIVMQRRGAKGSRGDDTGRGAGKSGRGGRGQKGGGPDGECVCPSCGKRTSHERGVPCIEVSCPECGTAMTRE
jgi:hypothetical protein